MGVYPRASAPVTPFVYRMALARAERWRKRYEDTAAELAALRDEADRPTEGDQ